MKEKVAVLLIVVTLSGCHNRPLSMDHIKSFNLEELPDYNPVKLSTLGFYNLEYIPLETNENCLIKSITDIRFGGDYFIIKSAGTIFKFDVNGTFLTKIGTIGRGPTEYTNAIDIDISNSKETIFIASTWQKKINVYSVKGDFIRSIPCPANTTNIRTCEDGILCYKMNSTGAVDSSFSLIDSSGLEIRDYPNKYHWENKSNLLYILVGENLFYRFNNKLIKKEVYSDTIFEFRKQEFWPVMTIESGSRLLNPTSRSEFNPNYLAENFYTPFNLFQFGDYIFYEFGLNKTIYCFVGALDENLCFFYKTEEGLINDLDGGPNLHPIVNINENTILGCISSIDLRNFVGTDGFKFSNPKYSEKKKELEQLASTLKETDNPVLILATLKH